jgi:hypothetical protein
MGGLYFESGLATGKLSLELRAGEFNLEVGVAVSSIWRSFCCLLKWFPSLLDSFETSTLMTWLRRLLHRESLGNNPRPDLDLLRSDDETGVSTFGLSTFTGCLKGVQQFAVHTFSMAVNQLSSPLTLAVSAMQLSLEVVEEDRERHKMTARVHRAALESVCTQQ